MATMYIEKRKVKSKLGFDTYYYLTVQEKKQKKRTYIPLRKVSAVMDLLEMRKPRKKRTEPDKAVNEPREKSFYPKSLKFILESAGYGVFGPKLRRGKKFLSKSAARVRFDLLDKESREMIGSPGNLLRINMEALSLLKRRNRYGMKTSYQKCMIAVMEKHIQK